LETINANKIDLSRRVIIANKPHARRGYDTHKRIGKLEIYRDTYELRFIFRHFIFWPWSAHKTREFRGIRPRKRQGHVPNRMKLLQGKQAPECW